MRSLVQTLVLKKQSKTKAMGKGNWCIEMEVVDSEKV
jgi:hypothetical protein